MVLGTLFVTVAALLCLLTLLAIFPITEIYMAHRATLERDGLAHGVRVPRWQLPDSSGRTIQSPPVLPFQLVMFTDHSLVSWPSVADGLRQLLTEPDLQIIILLDRPNEVAGPVLTSLGLQDIPAVIGSRALWARYNVRVAPFAIFVDHEGHARASSLVNHDWQLDKLWRIAQLPSDPSTVNTRPPVDQGQRSLHA